MTKQICFHAPRGLVGCLLAGLLLLLAVPVAAQDDFEDILAERQLVAESGEFLADASPIVAAASASSLAEAMDIPAAFVTGSSLSGPSAGTAVFSNLGVIQPKQGTSFAVLSCGVAGTSSPEPGTDFSPFGTAGDSVTLTLNLDIPEGITRLGFDFNFLSAEFPDFVGSAFNDTFSARLSDAGGTRTIAFASVNSSFFFAASGSRAGGSGYDIFTEDPSGVDFSFGGGLPDAGVTDYQSVSVPVTGGAPATLVFNIRDLGDGILDSAVVIDNLVLTSLEAVDPNPDLLSGDDVSTDPNTLATGGEPVDAAAADGVTRVLLRTTVPGAGMVEFSLDGASAPEDGGLGEVGSGDRLNSVLVPVEETSEGFQAFAVYLTPDDFNRGGDEGLAERPLRFRARFMPDNGDPAESELPFRLVRPPVVLIHGLWSSGATWTFPMANDGRFRTTVADYEQTNASLFSTNRLVPFNSIREALTGLRNQGIAATQVDVAGHSMGGILSRNHVRLPNYKRPDNFDEGDVHKLLTLNTPHTGSPLANVLVAIRDVLPDFLGEPVKDYLRDKGLAIDEGAVDNLQKGSGAILSIPRTLAPSHALVGIGGSDVITDGLAFVPGKLGIIFKIIDFLDENTDIFAGIQHDLIVGRRSQEGGISTSAISIFDGFGSIHTNVTGNPSYSSRVIELFNTPADDAAFDEFPAVITVAGPDFQAPIVTPSPGAAKMLVDGGLAITAPAAGATVFSGGTLPVTFAAQNGFALQKVLLLTDVEAAIVDTAPFAVDLPIPDTAIGPIDLLAIGTDGNGNYALAGPVTVTVVAPAGLDGVTLVNRDPILFGVGSTRQLGVIGHYADLVDRDISDGATGTQYLSSNPFVVSVSPDGLMTATGVGIATVVARNSGVQDSVTVTVLEQVNQVPIADAGPDQNVECASPAGAAVTLDGSGSSDPDGDPLTYTWSGSFGQLSGAVVSVDLPLGSHVVTLTVDDGNGGVAVDEATVVVADTTAPVITSLAASPDMLWPPNHKMVPVAIAATAVDACGAAVCAITQVSANEPIDGDVELTGSLTLELRAERLGSGDGRVYSVEVACTDDAGNAALGVAEVTVPHDQGN